MGVQPLAPGFRKIQIKPQPGNLHTGKITVPTILGAVQVEFQQEKNKYFELKVYIPVSSQAKIYLPQLVSGNLMVQFNGQMKKGELSGSFIFFDNVPSGEHVFKVRN